MKYVLIISFIGAIIAAQTATADCMKNQFGNSVCGKGECETDAYGKVYCADAGGGAIKDQYGKVQCGVGACATDDLGQVWCSKEPGGGAAVDSYGKVKCLGGCEAASSALCKEGQ